MLKLVRRVTDGVVAAQPKSMVRAIQSMARTSRGTMARRRPGSQTPVSISPLRRCGSAGRGRPAMSYCR